MTPSPGVVLVRVDNRLVHGQVLEAWVPALSVQGILVADDEARANALARSAMALAIPRRIVFKVAHLAEAAEMLRPGGTGAMTPRTLLLVRDVSGVVALREFGVVIPHLNIGNVHFGAGRKQVTPTVYLDAGELLALERLAASGTEVEARAVPAEAAVPLSALQSRFAAAK